MVGEEAGTLATIRCCHTRLEQGMHVGEEAGALARAKEINLYLLGNRETSKAL